MKEISIITTHLFKLGSEGQDAISGAGRDRYTWELCEMLQEMGMKVRIHQLTTNGSCHKQVGNIEVIGHQVNEEGEVHTLMQISAEAGGLLVYVDIETMGSSFPYRSGSIGLCYGIPSVQGKVAWDTFSREGDKDTTYNHLHQIVTVNSFALAWIRSYGSNHQQRKRVVIRQTVDSTRFKPMLHWGESRNTVRIVVPRLLDEGHEVVNTILMIDRILQRYPEVIVEFANDSEEENEFIYAFRLWLRDHPHKDRIVYEKYAFRKMSDAYRKAHLVVVPSFSQEGSTYSCLEAMSCGLPVIVGNCGGVNDLIVDGYNGILVEPFEDSFYVGITRLLDHADLRRYIGSNARRSIHAFDKKVWERQWMKLFKEILQMSI